MSLVHTPCVNSQGRNASLRDVVERLQKQQPSGRAIAPLNSAGGGEMSFAVGVEMPRSTVRRKKQVSCCCDSVRQLTCLPCGPLENPHERTSLAASRHAALRASAIHRHGQHVGDALAAQHDLQGLGVVAANLGSWLGTS